MTDSESSRGVTAHHHDGSLELRSSASPDAWIIADNPATVER
ncbi:hypothetical protein [Halorussus salilacus]|nr:hypothetical protein [Halorussus salilacus]